SMDDLDPRVPGFAAEAHELPVQLADELCEAPVVLLAQRARAKLDGEAQPRAHAPSGEGVEHRFCGHEGLSLGRSGSCDADPALGLHDLAGVDPVLPAGERSKRLEIARAL